MIQLTHLGRRTGWNKADWLPVAGAVRVREAGAPRVSQGDGGLGHRAHRRRLCRRRRAHAGGRHGRHRVRGLRPSDGRFWSPLTNHRDDEYGGSLDNRLRFTDEVLDAVRAAVGPDFIVGIRMVADEDLDKGLSRTEGVEIARRLAATRQGRLPQHHPRPYRDRCGADRGDPDHRHALGAASRFRRRGAGRDQVPGLPRRAHLRTSPPPAMPSPRASSTWSA